MGIKWGRTLLPGLTEGGLVQGSAVLFGRNKDLLQLVDYLVSAGEGDVVDLVCNFLYVFHFLQFEEHGIVFHQLGGVQQVPG